MKTKDLLTAKFHCREPGDDAKAGNSRESIRAIVMSRRRDAIRGRRPPPCRTPNCFIPLVSLGVVANDGSA
jgi:hypothetical protein